MGHTYTRAYAQQHNSVPVYSHSILQELTSQPDNDVVLNVIDKDLDRTFPSHVLFAKDGSQGYVDSPYMEYAINLH